MNNVYSSDYTINQTENRLNLLFYFVSNSAIEKDETLY